MRLRERTHVLVMSAYDHLCGHDFLVDEICV